MDNMMDNTGGIGAERPPRFDDSFIIPEASDPCDRPRTLLLAGPAGWELPRWVHPARHGRTGRDLDGPFWPAALQRELRRPLGGEWEGLDVWVPHRRLVAPWAEADAFLAPHVWEGPSRGSGSTQPDTGTR
jgi:hypothetical protein